MLGQRPHLHVPDLRRTSKENIGYITRGAHVLHHFHPFARGACGVHTICSLLCSPRGGESGRSTQEALSWPSPGCSFPSCNGASPSSCFHQKVSGALASGRGLLPELCDPQFRSLQCMCVHLRKLVGLSVTASDITDLSLVQ